MIAEDRYVNTFHVVGPIPLEEIDYVAIKDAIVQFYKPTASSGISEWLSNYIRVAGRTLRIYDLADTKPRAPVYEWVDSAVPWTTQAAESGMPGEVALCLSYEAPKISGVPQARRRGRIYLGPFNTQVTADNATTAACRPQGGLINAMLTHADVLKAALATAGVVWCVYSPTTDTAQDGDPDSMSAITKFWVDNAFDTQRRRGEAPTTRQISAGST